MWGIRADLFQKARDARSSTWIKVAETSKRSSDASLILWSLRKQEFYPQTPLPESPVSEWMMDMTQELLEVERESYLVG